MEARAHRLHLNRIDRAAQTGVGPLRAVPNHSCFRTNNRITERHSSIESLRNPPECDTNAYSGSTPMDLCGLGSKVGFRAGHRQFINPATWRAYVGATWTTTTCAEPLPNRPAGVDENAEHELSLGCSRLQRLLSAVVYFMGTRLSAAHPEAPPPVILREDWSRQYNHP